MALLDSHGHKVLLAASMVSMALGSIHAFSVFLIPLETKYGSSRASISLIYSSSLVFLTLAVLLGPLIYSRLKPATIYFLVVVIGALGVIVAGIGGSLALVWLGYSLIFGIANGLGYGFGLQYAARANPDKAGLAVGVITAAYALGAVVAPYGFEVALDFGGFLAAMLALGATLLVVSIWAALVVDKSGVQYAEAGLKTASSKLSRRKLSILWFAYGSGVAAGLMAIGHASGIATGAGLSGWQAAAVIAVCNLVGSLLSGWFADRMSHRFLLSSLPIISAFALLLLAVVPTQSFVLLGLLGFAYGGTIAVYPTTISRIFGVQNGPRAYGRVFTAWGAAGLLAPWFAGKIFDASGSYAPALWIAAGLSLLSAIVIQQIFRDQYI